MSRYRRKDYRKEKTTRGRCKPQKDGLEDKQQIMNAVSQFIETDMNFRFIEELLMLIKPVRTTMKKIGN